MSDQEQFRGVVAMPKSHFWDDLWLCEAFSRGQAWLDLWALANDRKRLLKMRGVDVTVERGQLGWSLQALADRWHWSRDKVRQFLADLQDERKVTLKTTNVTTVVTVLDYGLYNPDTEPELGLPLTPELTPESTAEPTAKPITETAAESTAEPTAKPTQNRGTKELRKREQGTGEGRPAAGGAFAEVPSDEDVGAFCRTWAGDLSRGIPGGIPEVWWTGWLAARLSSDRPFPCQWQRALVLAFTGDWIAGHAKARGQILEKKPAAPGGRPAVVQMGGLPAGWQEGDCMGWWTEPVGILQGTLTGMVLGGQEKTAARLRAIIQERTR